MVDVRESGVSERVLLCWYVQEAFDGRSEEEVFLSLRPREMTVVSLKAALRARGLSTTGKKALLVSRVTTPSFTIMRSCLPSSHRLSHPSPHPTTLNFPLTPTPLL